MTDSTARPEFSFHEGITRARRQGYLDADHIPEIHARYVRGNKHGITSNRATLAAEYGVSEREIVGAANGNRCTVAKDGARCPHVGRIVRGLCPKHLRRQKENGDPLTLHRTKRLTLTDLRAAAAATTDECITPAGTDERPRVRYDGRKMWAARAVWIIANGDPGDKDVLHTCNGGSGDAGCINIRHLKAGDDVENHQDMDAAGRRAVAERHGNALLANAQAEEIHRRYVPGTGPYNRGNAVALAEEFGVHRSAITAIARGESYRKR